ncbi:hypothetical protein DRN74_02905 [Candidatus Micrarchaeota archaeon]|nr:MAG: hypothetical protein DRN74_02905 [Candidatus Micrarchaeota archaeon]
MRSCPIKSVKVKIIRFMLILAAFGLLLNIVDTYVEKNFMQDYVAEHSALLLRLFGINAVARENIIVMEKSEAVIIPACVGLYAVFAITALIVATPDVKPKEKLKSLLWAVPLMYLVNLLRLSLSFYVMESYGIAYYSIVHNILWRVAMPLFALLLWACWLNKQKAYSKKLYKPIFSQFFIWKRKTK